MWQGSEYASGCNCGRVLNIPGFRVSQLSAYGSVAQGSECDYAWSTFHRVLNKPAVLSMPGLSICQIRGYVRVTKDAEYAWICLNPLMPGGNKKDHTYLNKPAAFSWH